MCKYNYKYNNINSFSYNDDGVVLYTTDYLI